MKRNSDGVVGVSTEQLEQMLLSVGRANQERRPLTPVEVGGLCLQALEAGTSRTTLTAELGMTDQSMIAKFIRVAQLSPVVRHLVDWGRSGRGAIGFSVASQLGRFAREEQEQIAESILKHELTKTEMIGIHQLYERSGDSLEACVARMVRRRPVTITRFVFVGAVADKEAQVGLAERSQRQRDRLLEAALTRLIGRRIWMGAKLGQDRFAVLCAAEGARVIEAMDSFEIEIGRSIAIVLREGTEGKRSDDVAETD